MFHPGYTRKVSSWKWWKRISGRKSIDGLKKAHCNQLLLFFFDQLQSADRVCHLLCLLSCCQAVLEWRSMCICAGHPLPMTCYSSHTVIIKYIATALTCYQSVQTDSRLHTNPPFFTYEPLRYSNVLHSGDSTVTPFKLIPTINPNRWLEISIYWTRDAQVLFRYCILFIMIPS